MKMEKMGKSIITITILMTMLLSVASLGFAETGIGFGADIVSRYVWRGTDFGNAVSIQPGMSITTGEEVTLEIGAWASYAIDNGSVGTNENDLYVTVSFADFGLTVTDYYFPEGKYFSEYGDEDGSHILEVSASYSIAGVSLLGAYNFHGDADDSMYFELGYTVGTFDDVEANVFLGAGDGVYSYKSRTESDVEIESETSGDFNVVNVGITFSKDALSASYIVNPTQETNFLVFGYSF